MKGLQEIIKEHVTFQLSQNKSQCIYYIQHIEEILIANSIQHIQERTALMNLGDGVDYIEECFNSDPDLIVLVGVDSLLVGENKDSSFLYRFKNNLFECIQKSLPVIIIGTTPVSKLRNEISFEEINLNLTDSKSIRSLLCEYYPHNKISPSIISLFRGLNIFEVQSIVKRGFDKGVEIGTPGMVLEINEFKKATVEKSGILKMETFLKDSTDDKESILDEIGGYINVKNKLRKDKQKLEKKEQLIANGIALPKGFLVTGLPGCGKSFIAKIVARYFNLPLISFDISQILGKYMGDSEKNIAEAFRLIEYVSPCVVLFDEIEKLFAGANDGHEVSRRIFGQFLAWMQNREQSNDLQYVIATSNSIENLPVETFRTGRFDTQYYVDLPNEITRRAIFESDKVIKEKYQCCDLAQRSNLYSGADIQSIIKELKCNAIINEDNYDSSESIDQIFGEIKPEGEKNVGKLNAIRKLYSENNFIPVGDAIETTKKELLDTKSGISSVTKSLFTNSSYDGNNTSKEETHTLSRITFEMWELYEISCLKKKGYSQYIEGCKSFDEIINKATRVSKDVLNRILKNKYGGTSFTLKYTIESIKQERSFEKDYLDILVSQSKNYKEINRYKQLKKIVQKYELLSVSPYTIQEAQEYIKIRTRTYEEWEKYQIKELIERKVVDRTQLSSYTFKRLISVIGDNDIYMSRIKSYLIREFHLSGYSFASLRIVLTRIKEEKLFNKLWTEL